MRYSIGHCIITKWGYIICFFHTIKKKLPFYHKRVLILKTDGFGDMLFWFPYMKQLYEYYSARNFRVSLVTSPTGTAHIAAVNGTTVFIICGYGDYGTFVPYPEGREGKDVFSIFPEKFCTRCSWKNPECIKKPIYPCITQVTVEQVFESIETHVCLP